MCNGGAPCTLERKRSEGILKILPLKHRERPIRAGSHENSQGVSPFLSFKEGERHIKRRIVDMDVANDVTCTRQSVITHMVIRFL